MLWPWITIMMTLPAPTSTPAESVESKHKDGVARYAIEQFFATRAIGASDWAPDGRRLVFVANISGRNNLWLVPSEGGWPTQLTISDERQEGPAWSPDGRWIAFQSDHQADEQWDVFLVSAQTGEVVNLTGTPEVSEESPVWSHDSRMLACAVKPHRDPNYEIVLLDPAARSKRSLTAKTPPDLSFTPVAFSRDGRLMLANRSHASGKDGDVVLIAVDSGKQLLVTPHKGEQTWAATALSPDGGTVLATSNAKNGFDNAALIDVRAAVTALVGAPKAKKGAKDAAGDAMACPVRWLTEDRWEISTGSFSPDGRAVTWSANVDGNGDLFLCDVTSGTPRRLEVGPGYNTLAGSASPFSADGTRLAFYRNGAASPHELGVLELPGGDARLVTNSFVGGVDAGDMVEPYLVHYPSRDRFTISAYVYIPWNLARDGSHPAVVFVHGGPTAQSVNSFNRALQFLVNHGYVVIAPNYRGSTGYGKLFMDANRFDMGGGDLEDCARAVDFLKETGYVDPRKIAIYGGSYGGYLTMAAVTKKPDLWAAGCALFPFVNWFTEVEHEDPQLRQYDLSTMGDPVKDAARYRDRSPIFFVDQIRAPVLLIAGKNDPRCPPEEAGQVYEAVNGRGGVCEYRLYDDEGHGFARRENMFDAYRRVLAFLETHVRNASPPAAAPRGADAARSAKP